VTGLTITTERLLIRCFTDADTESIHRILDQSFGDGSRVTNPDALAERRSWVRWQALNDQWFPRMLQAPYGDRAVVLAHSGEPIGSVGYVPLLGPFDQVPGLADPPGRPGWIPEFGLFWVIAAEHRGNGYATEAARALIGHALGELGLRRVLALTEHTNLASQAVMRRAGMTVLANPTGDPHWLQVIGVAT
jgi:RimJ/RimL family protein N-acetyltransferase